MNNHTLELILGKVDSCVRDHFLGVFSADQTINKPSGPKHFVVLHDQPFPKPGHWQCLYLEKDGNAYRGEFFCSFGFPPLAENMKRFINQYCGKNWIRNRERLQSLDTTVCGHYCVYFLIMRCRGYPLKDVVTFLNNHCMPDVFVFNEVFNKIIKM